jgi:hypothetical protein
LVIGYRIQPTLCRLAALVDQFYAEIQRCTLGYVESYRVTRRPMNDAQTLLHRKSADRVVELTRSWIAA